MLFTGQQQANLISHILFIPHIAIWGISIYRVYKKCFTKLWDMVPYTETKIKSLHEHMSRQLHFGAMALFNFRTFKYNSLHSIS
jgi:hypothetical protein